MAKAKTVGRPKLPKDQRQKYGRIAVYPETHARIKKLAENAGQEMIEWLENNIPQL